MNRLAKNSENASVIIATASKKGLLKGFIEASVKMQPREFIYLSFNPDTLVCDKQNGYETKAITPIDVAPQTPDMMCICRLDKEN